MKKSIYSLFTSLLLTSSLIGGVMWSDKQVVTFKPESSTLSHVTWQPEGRFNITEKGLGWEGDPASQRNVTLRFKPIATGNSWRAPTGAMITIKAFSDRRGYILNSGQKSKPSLGSFYVRYSVDRKSWSSWIPVNRDRKHVGKYGRFFAQLDVPNLNQIEYRKHYNAYRKLDVPWVDDQDALCRWIAKKDEDFFSKHIPFIGWVEVLYEADIGGSRRLTEIEIEVDAVLSGMHSIPRDPNQKIDYESPWKFRKK